MAQIMAGAAHAHILHHLNADGLVIDLDPAHTAQALAEHVIVDDQRFKAEAEKRGMHAGRLIDHVEAGQAGHHQRAALLVSGLRIGHL